MKSLRQTALDLLSRREHSRAELYRKLSKHEFAADDINAVLDKLQHEKLLSDERFAEAYTTMRSKRGYGPERIKQELQERGVSAILTDQCVDALSAQWQSLAEGVRQKKFGSIIPTDYAARAKQKQFLFYRGFTSEQINSAFKSEE